MIELNETAKAVDILAESLSMDKEYFKTWTDNIAMHMYDAIVSLQREKRKQDGQGISAQLNRVELHSAVNLGAISFLNTFVRSHVDLLVARAFLEKEKQDSNE
jgi:ABC-type maltose transport system permease subunit